MNFSFCTTAEWIAKNTCRQQSRIFSNSFCLIIHSFVVKMSLGIKTCPDSQWGQILYELAFDSVSCISMHVQRYIFLKFWVNQKFIGAQYFVKFRLRMDVTPTSFSTQCRTSLIWHLFLQVSNGPILDILFGFGQHLHPGFNESWSFSGRGLRCGINDMANWRKLQNCNCSHLDNLRDFLHTTHIFTWRKRKYITGYILLWIFA